MAVILELWLNFNLLALFDVILSNPRQLNPKDDVLSYLSVVENMEKSFEICLTVRSESNCMSDVSMNRVTNLSNELRAASHIWSILHGNVSIVFFVGHCRNEMFHFVV